MKFKLVEDWSDSYKKNIKEDFEEFAYRRGADFDRLNTDDDYYDALWNQYENELELQREMEDEYYIDEAFDDDDFSSNKQEFSSANTSINSSKLPAVFNKVKFKPGTINLDYGGGKFDNATEFLAQQDVTNLIFDKFNRSEDHNRDVIKKVRQNGGADTATCSNVLNVIKERDIRVNEVIKNIRSMLKPGGTAYFTVYEGTGAGDSRETKAGYQLNKKTADYVEEIAEIFGDNNVSRKGSVIIARK